MTGALLWDSWDILPAAGGEAPTGAADCVVVGAGGETVFSCHIP